MIWRKLLVLCLSTVATGVGLSACGSDDDDESCPGVICNNCAASGDCSIDCPEGKTEACVGLEYFGGDNPDDLRCAFCQ